MSSAGGGRWGRRYPGCRRCTRRSQVISSYLAVSILLRLHFGSLSYCCHLYQGIHSPSKSSPSSGLHRSKVCERMKLEVVDAIIWRIIWRCTEVRATPSCRVVRAPGNRRNDSPSIRSQRARHAWRRRLRGVTRQFAAGVWMPTCVAAAFLPQSRNLRAHAGCVRGGVRHGAAWIVSRGSCMNCAGRTRGGGDRRRACV
jgi:hypothetical protein